jgi:mxaJ protein
MRTLIFAVGLALAPFAQAHSGAQQDGEIWLTALVFAIGGWYSVGFCRVYADARGGRSMLLRQGGLFASGWAVIAASLLTPLHTLGGRSFTAHMIEHELLMLVAAPLMAWSRPIGVLLWAFPEKVRHALGGVGHRRWFANAWSSISTPLAASLLQAAAMWIWHAPTLFNMALLNEGWHAAQHLSFVFSALLFWWSINVAATRERRPGVAAFWLFFTSIHSGFLGALMTFAQSPWYPRYIELGLHGAGGLTPLEDQQLAGVIMWIPGGIVHAIVALAYLGRWLKLPKPVLPAVLPVLFMPIILLALMFAPHAQARQLRVCADPNNLPFSNEARQGFENRLVDWVAQDLEATVTYEWWAQRRGNVRETLQARRCDVIPGIASNLEMLATTRPYYRSAYVFVTRQDRKLALSGFDDQRLRTLTLGVQMIGDDFSNTPPAHALARRGIVQNVRGFMVYGDYAQAAPSRGIIDAVAQGELDVAIVWGPLAGYFANKSKQLVALQTVAPLNDGTMLPMMFDISMGVRKEDRALRDELDEVLERRRPEIRRLLSEYGVPVLEED